ncbi:MAG: hypothetical protein IJ242_17430 [Clostridia bacterium]|nr:hypothetical protein [Clostridia bacterium]
MGIIRQLNKKNGKVMIYETYTETDPETGRKRTRRKYLGTENPDDGSIIPSSGKRGRKPGIPNRPKVVSEEALSGKIDELRKLQAEEQALMEQIRVLKQQTAKMHELFQSISKVLSTLSDEMHDTKQQMDK